MQRLVRPEPAILVGDADRRFRPVRAGRGWCPSADDGVSKMDRV